MSRIEKFPIRDVNVEASPDPTANAHQIGEMVLENGICVVRQFASNQEAMEARGSTRNLLIPSTPLRALRVGAERVLGRANTPDFLQRRPIQLLEPRWHLLGAKTLAVMQRIQALNYTVAATQPISEVYGEGVHLLNTAILNRFAPHEEFEPHQDSVKNVGLSYVIQTSPTLWYIHEGGPLIEHAPYSFTTGPGDLVVQTQRSGELDTTMVHRHTGFTDFAEDGSAVHSGLNLTPKNRFSIQLFSDQTTAEV